MSQMSEMYDRFFAGSKYEDKWRKRNVPPPKPESRLEEIDTWLGRLKGEREIQPAGKQPVNPFQRPKDQRAA